MIRANREYASTPCVPEDVRAVMRSYLAETEFGVVIVARDLQLDEWPADLNLGKVQQRDGLGMDRP